MAPLDAQSCAMSMSVKRNEADLVDNEKAATGGASAYRGQRGHSHR
ncbi:MULTISPECIES: hypothetical protein [unclassified Mesorhizobium]|nr:MULTISPECIES: hypothetical protein [unclassified Mesorhizobium]